MGLAIPGVADAANGFAETNRKIHDSLEALRFGEGQAVAVGEQHLGVAEDSSKRIVDFVAKHFADIFGAFVPRRPKSEFGNLRPTETAFEQSGNQWNVFPGTRNEVPFAAG